MTGWCVEHAREEGIYKSRKVMGIPRKVVQCLFFNREICLCCFCERTQTNLLRFLVSLSFRRLSRTNNVFRAPSVTGTLHWGLNLRERNFFSKNYIYFLKLTKDRLHYVRNFMYYRFCDYLLSHSARNTWNLLFIGVVTDVQCVSEVT